MNTFSKLLVGAAVSSAFASPLVTVKNGTIRGTYSKEWDQDFFLGIPYAQPPTGQLRFKWPQSINESYGGELDATRYGDSCYQYNNYYTMSEDCLTLNVVRPAGYENVSLPVLLWIYGGGLYWGSSADPQYNMSGIVKTAAESEPFIGVSIEYRLGIWGFLNGPEVQAEGSSNAGLLDQRLAMRWVQENIAGLTSNGLTFDQAFGGDPTRVTLWGESAGAQSIAYHLHSYDGRDDKLYSAAILESGSTVGCQLNALPYYNVAYENLTRSTGCWTSSNRLGCLRALSASALYDARQSLTWNPIVDGDFLTAYPASQLAPAGKFVKVPLLIGTNTDEGVGFSIRGANTSQDLFNALLYWRNYVLSPPSIDRLLDLYPDIPLLGTPEHMETNKTFPSYGLQWRRAGSIGGDLVMHSGRRKMSEQYSGAGVRDVYSYRFDTPLWNASVATLPAGGVKHFDNVMFSFQNISGALGPMPDYQHYQNLAITIGKAYAAFVSRHNPNRNESALPHWPRYKVEDPKNMVLNADGSWTEPDTWRRDGIDLINEISRELLA